MLAAGGAGRRGVLVHASLGGLVLVLCGDHAPGTVCGRGRRGTRVCGPSGWAERTPLRTGLASPQSCSRSRWSRSSSPRATPTAQSAAGGRIWQARTPTSTTPPTSTRGAAVRWRRRLTSHRKRRPGAGAERDRPRASSALPTTGSSTTSAPRRRVRPIRPAPGSPSPAPSSSARTTPRSMRWRRSWAWGISPAQALRIRIAGYCGFATLGRSLRLHPNRGVNPGPDGDKRPLAGG